MTTATVTIEIDQTTAALLQAKAAMQSVSLNMLLQRLATNGMAATEEAGSPANLEQFIADMESLAEGTELLPTTPITYSREDIYFDHD